MRISNRQHFNESAFISELANDINTFVADKASIDEDFTCWSSLILKQLNNRAPVKGKRVKTKRLPERFTPDITHMQRLRDKSKRIKQWGDYKKKYRNKTKQLIRQAKHNYFTNCIDNSNDTKSIWKHLRSVNNGSKTTSCNLPEELTIDNLRITDPENVATKLNLYFVSVSDILNENNSTGSSFDSFKINQYVDSKVPQHMQFTLPFITTEQVKLYINNLEHSKALDG